MSHTLELILLLLAAAVVAIVVCRLARLPPILGYLVVGIVVGTVVVGAVVTIPAGLITYQRLL